MDNIRVLRGIARRLSFLTMLGRYDFSIPIRLLTGAAGFLLAFRKGPSVKWLDAVAIVLGVLMLADRTGMELLRQNAKQVRHFILVFGGIVSFIILAELLNSSGSFAWGVETYTSYGRLLFNGYILLLAALLVVRGKDFLWWLSIGMFLAPLAVLLAFGNLEEGVFISGGRLAGYLQNPIIFGAWMLVTFIIGLGVMVSLRKLWQRIVFFCWFILLANFMLWSASRAAWIALGFAVCAFVFLLLYQKRHRSAALVVLVVVSAFIIGYTFLPREVGMKQFVNARATNLAASMATLRPGRIGAQNHTLTMPRATRFILRHPLGTGFAGTAFGNRGFGAERVPESNNSFLEIATYGGLCGLFMFIVLLGDIARHAWIVLWKPRGSSSGAVLTTVWLIAGGAFFLDIFFTQGFLWRHTWFILGVIAGIAYVKPSPGVFQIVERP